MGEAVISLQNVSKCFKRYGHPADRLKELLFPGKKKAEEFWALQDINLEIYPGEALGIIGQNGSGKSTLLQIIVGTLVPTTGNVKVCGRVSALLELGSGFNPEFTGRQNVFFNGRVLGLSQEELEARFDEIQAFADIGDFIDEPVKTYSSGMFVRLAFAVAVSTEPEILIVDEALAVGDVYFQQKCFERIKQLKESGTTLLFVSHDTRAVYALCETAVLLESGKLLLKSKPKSVLDLYEAKLLKKYDTNPESLEIQTVSSEGEEISTFEVEELNLTVDESNQLSQAIYDLSREGGEEEVVVSSKNVKVQFVHILDERGQRVDSVISDQIAQISVGVLFLQAFDDPIIGFALRDRTGLVIFSSHTRSMKVPIHQVTSGTLLEVRFKFQVPLVEGEYTVTVGVANRGLAEGLFEQALAYIHSTAVLKVLRNKDAIHWGGVVNLDPNVNVFRKELCLKPSSKQPN